MVLVDGISGGSETVVEVADGHEMAISVRVFVKLVEYVEVRDKISGVELVLSAMEVKRCAALAAAPKNAKMHESSCRLRPIPPWLRGSVSCSYICDEKDWR